MTPSRKAILTIWIGIALFVAILYVVLRNSVIAAALDLEAIHTREDVQRIRLAIRKTVDRMGAINSDWAQWDDSYKFVADRNQEFIQRNLVPVTFTTLNLDIIAYFDRAGRVVYAGYCPCRPAGVTPVGNGTLGLLRSAVTAPGAAPTGILVARNRTPPLGRAPLLIASHPILTSHASGPSRGTLVFGLVFDKHEVNKLAALTRLNVDVESIPEGLSTDFRRALSHITPAHPIYIVADTDERVDGYGVMDDIFGRPAIMVRVRSPRGFYSEGRALVGYVLIALVSAGLIYVLASTLVLWWSGRREAELEAHKRAFYRSTILAATEGKLVISERRTIDDIAGPAVASWELREPYDVGVVRAAIRPMAEGAGMSGERIDSFLLCAGEAATNAVKHANGGTASLHLGDDGLIFVVSDTGPGIEATAIPEVALRHSYSTAVSLGIGYKVMISLADRVYLATSLAGTTVAICMDVQAPAEEAPLFPHLDQAWE